MAAANTLYSLIAKVYEPCLWTLKFNVFFLLLFCFVFLFVCLFVCIFVCFYKHDANIIVFLSVALIVVVNWTRSLSFP